LKTWQVFNLVYNRGIPGGIEMETNRNRGSLFVGVILIVAGVLFLLSRILGMNGWGAYWPFIIIVIGAAFFVGMAIGGRNAGVLAIPGSIIVMVGLILLLQNWLSIWETWAYAWTLIVCAVGLGIAFFGIWSDQPDLRNSGFSLARLGLVLFVVFGVLFEFIFSFGSGVQRLKSPFWPVLLIVVGLGLLVYRSINLLNKRSKVSWDDRDLFWPVLMAGFGLLWLLVNLNYLPMENMAVLIGLWPALLVAAGLDLLVGRRWPLAGALLGCLMAAGLIWVAVNVDQLQLDTRFPSLLSWEDLTGGSFNTERVTGSGVLKQENRPLKGFHRISIEAGGVAEISQAQSPGASSLVVSADENLLPYILSEVHGGELRIYVKPGVSLSPSQPLRYTIIVDTLAALDVSGSSQANMSQLSGDQLALQASGMGKINLGTIQVNKLVVKTSGSGSIETAGQTASLELDMSGASRLKSEDLQSQTATVEMSGSAQALVWVIQSLEAQLSGSASLQYYGAPTTQQNTSGSASVQGLGSK
jgi:hypothetical protein